MHYTRDMNLKTLARLLPNEHPDKWRILADHNGAHRGAYDYNTDNEWSTVEAEFRKHGVTICSGRHCEAHHA